MPETASANRIATLELDADPAAPALARACVRDTLSTFDATVLNDVLLAVSELVTNAVKHGATPVSMTLETEPGLLRLAVHDGGSDAMLPAPSRPTVTAGSGRGLLLVAAVSESWGVTPYPVQPGKTVWASFPAPAQAPVTVRLTGELDMATTERTAVQFREVHLASGGEVRLDLSDVTFIDSAVLHLFADLQARALAQGCRVQVVGASSSVRRVLVITGLGDLLEPSQS